MRYEERHVAVFVWRTPQVVRRVTMILFFANVWFGLGAAQDLNSQVAERRELVILNWSDYMHPDLVREFEALHDIRIKEVYYAFDQGRDRMLLQNKGSGFDLVIVDGASISNYVDRGWLAQFTSAEIPNLKNVDPKWINAYSGAPGYAVPYFWGTLGISYRQDLVSHEFRSWKDLFVPDNELRQRILMMRDPRETIGMALLSLGHSPNSTEPEELSEAEALLLKQRSFVRDYSYLSLKPESEMISGEIWASMMFSGDALSMRELDERIAFVVPDEGTWLWADYWVVLRSSKNQDLARAFIDFVNVPKNAAALAQYLHYATPNFAARDLLPDSFLADSFVFPPNELIAKSEFYAELPPRAVRRYATILSNILAWNPEK